jgi:hypothetical protein
MGAGWLAGISATGYGYGRGRIGNIVIGIPRMRR